jgi:DNA ligase-1
VTTTWKPMLAPNETPDFKTLRFPMLASTKLDGIRCTMQGGRLLSRSLKEIPNRFVQERFTSLGLPDGMDGELICGDPSNDPYKRTHSIVMSDEKTLDFYGDTIRWHIFDKFHAQDGFRVRHEDAKTHVCVCNSPYVRLVKHVSVRTIEELEVFERSTLAQGFEGVMLRAPEGPYKQGRATLGQGWLIKVKRYQEAEALIMDCYAEQENTNEEFTNELGRTARSSAQAGKVDKDQLGGFNVVGQGAFYNGIDFKVPNSSITHDDRKKLWEGRDDLKGKLLVYKFFPCGSDVRPRHPVFKWFRDRRDV